MAWPLIGCSLALSVLATWLRLSSHNGGLRSLLAWLHREFLCGLPGSPLLRGGPGAEMDGLGVLLSLWDTFCQGMDVVSRLRDLNRV